AGVGGLLLLAGRPAHPAGPLPLLALGAALVLAGRDLARPGVDSWGALGRALVAVGGIGVHLIGAARGPVAEPLGRRASGLLLLAAAGLSLACVAVRLELLLLGQAGAVAATLLAARAAGWIEPGAGASLLGQALVGLGLVLLGAGTLAAS